MVREGDPWKLNVFNENMNKEGFNHYLILDIKDAADHGQGNAVATFTRKEEMMKMEMV